MVTHCIKICIFFRILQFVICKLYEEQTPIQIEENEIMISDSAQELMFQSNLGNINQIYSIGYNLWEEAFKMENFAQGKLIQILFLNSLHFQSELVHCVCQLIQNEESYFIKCIDGLRITNKKLQMSETAKTYVLPINLNQEEKCDQMFQNTDNQIILLCQTNSFFGIYKINLYNQQITFQKSQNNFQQSKCKNKFFNYKNYLILAFYDCQSWIIFNLSNDQFEILLDYAQFSILNKLSEPYQVKDIIFCQTFIYVLINNFYYLYEIQVDQLLLLQQASPTKNPIVSLVFENCQVNAILTESNISNIINFNSDIKEITIKEGIFSQYFSTPNYIILKNNSQIILALSAQFNQTYNVLTEDIKPITLFSSNFIKVYLPNLFYQIDSAEKISYFYEIKKFRKSLLINQAFLYKLLSFNFFFNTQIKDIIKYKIIVKDLKYYQHLESLDFDEVQISNQCQSESYFFVDKGILLSPQQIGIKPPSTLNSIIQLTNIQDEKYYFDMFPNLTNYRIKQLLQQDNINHEAKYPNIVFITNEDELINLNDKNKVIYKSNIQGKMIFTYNEIVFIVENNLKEVIILSGWARNLQPNKYTFTSQVRNIKQFQQYLIFQYESGEIYVIEARKTTLMYLDEQLQNYGMPLCFFVQRKFQIVQYKTFIAIKLDDGINQLYSFEDVSIVSYQVEGFGIKIKTIHNVKNVFTTYYFDGDELLKEYEYILENTQLARPLLYQFSSQILAIACLQNYQKSIQIFSFDKQFKILNNKATINFYFKYIQGKLFYFNEKNQLVCYDIFKYNISFKNIPTQPNYFNQYNLSIITTHEINKFVIDIKNNLMIGILNQCYNIINTTNQIFIQNYASLINIRQIFYGPIQSIFTNNYDQISVSGPFLYLENITSCGQINLNQYCLQNFDIKYKNNLEYLKLECIINNSQIIYNFCKLQVINGIIILRKYIILSDQKLLINLILFNEKAYLHVFQFLQDKYQLNELIFLNIQNQNINYFDNFLLYKNFSQNGNLFMINQNPKVSGQMNFFYIKENQIKLYDFEDKVSDYCLIDNSSEWYLIFSDERKIDEHFHTYYEISIIMFQNDQVSLLHTFKFGDDFKKDLQEKMLFDSTLVIEEFNIQIYSDKSCQKDDNQVKFSLFFELTKFSCEIELFLNLSTHQISFQLSKVFRNPLQNFSFDIPYVDESLLILQSRQTNNVYLYNLSENKLSQDYFSLQKNFEFQLFKLNTTHYIFMNYDCNCLTIGIIGYKFIFKNMTQQSYLIAENSISQAKVEIILLKDQEIKSHILTWNLIIVIIIVVFCFLFFLIRRRILKIKEIKKFKIIQNFEK